MVKCGLIFGPSSPFPPLCNSRVAKSAGENPRRLPCRFGVSPKLLLRKYISIRHPWEGWWVIVRPNGIVVRVDRTALKCWVRTTCLVLGSPLGDLTTKRLALHISSLLALRMAPISRKLGIIISLG